MGQCLDSGPSLADGKKDSLPATGKGNTRVDRNNTGNFIEEIIRADSEERKKHEKSTAAPPLKTTAAAATSSQPVSEPEGQEEREARGSSELFDSTASHTSEEKKKGRTGVTGQPDGKESLQVAFDVKDKGPHIGSPHYSDTNANQSTLQAQFSLIQNDNRHSLGQKEVFSSSIASRLQQGSQSKYLVFSYGVKDNNMLSLMPTTSSGVEESVLEKARPRRKYFMYLPLIIPPKSTPTGEETVWDFCKNIYNNNLLEIINYHFLPSVGNPANHAKKAVNSNIVILHQLPKNSIRYYPPNKLLFESSEKRDGGVGKQDTGSGPSNAVRLLPPPQLRIQGNRHVSIFVLEVCESVLIEDCEYCVIHIGPTIGEVTLRQSHHLLFVGHCGQLTIEETCQEVVLSVLCPDLPLISPVEKDKGKGRKRAASSSFTEPQEADPFPQVYLTTPSPFFLYNELPVHLRAARLGVLNNNYTTVRDCTTMNHPARVAGGNPPPKKKRPFHYLDPWDLDLAMWIYIAVYDSVDRNLKEGGDGCPSRQQIIQEKLTKIIDSINGASREGGKSINKHVALLLTILAQQPSGLSCHLRVTDDTAADRLPLLPKNIQDVLYLYKYGSCTPFTMGANLIPPCYFKMMKSSSGGRSTGNPMAGEADSDLSGRWRLKLFLVTNKDGGWGVLQRVLHDIERERKRMFLKHVKKHFKNLPAKSPKEGFEYASLSARMGPVVLLNTAELKCTELLIQEFVAPLFYTLCEPVGLQEMRKNQTPAAADTMEDLDMTDENQTHLRPDATTSGENASGAGGLAKWFKFLRVSAETPSTQGEEETQKKKPPHVTKQAQKEQQKEEEMILQYNVRMRRLFGRTLAKMTNQTCSCLLALIPPDLCRHEGPKGDARTGLQEMTDRAAKVFQPMGKKEERERERGYGHCHLENTKEEGEGGEEGKNNLGLFIDSSTDSSSSSDEEDEKDDDEDKTTPSHPTDDNADDDSQSWEQRVWHRSVLLNISLPTRHVSLLQSSLFFKAQLSSQKYTKSNTEFLNP